MNDGDRGEAGAECPSGKAYAYPDGHVPEIVFIELFFDGVPEIIDEAVKFGNIIHRHSLSCEILL